MKKTRILVVDDEPAIRKMIGPYLKDKGFDPVLAGNGDEALRLLNENNPDMVILDVKMPGMNGFEVCRLIREFSNVPIMMVTAMGNDEDVMYGLECGADDYITKPFNVNVLLARIQAVLRRSSTWDNNDEPEYNYEGLTIDFVGHHVSVNEQEVDLTATENRLISYLAVNANRIVTSDQILENVWGEEYVGEHNMLQVHVARLRHKLQDDAKNPRFVLTKPGIGYTMHKS
jgi:two-component system alkaline phosphatase synthesis response regulator PhoP